MTPTTPTEKHAGATGARCPPLDTAQITAVPTPCNRKAARSNPLAGSPPAISEDLSVTCSFAVERRRRERAAARADLVNAEPTPYGDVAAAVVKDQIGGALPKLVQ